MDLSLLVLLQIKFTLLITLNNTVSVINSINNTKIGNDIKVGNGPFAIGVAPDKGKVYVANSGNNTVSVIDEKNNAKIVDIKVGNGPCRYRCCSRQSIRC